MDLNGSLNNNARPPARRRFGDYIVDETNVVPSSLASYADIPSITNNVSSIQESQTGKRLTSGQGGAKVRTCAAAADHCDVRTSIAQPVGQPQGERRDHGRFWIGKWWGPRVLLRFRWAISAHPFPSIFLYNVPQVDEIAHSEGAFSDNQTRPDQA